MEWKNRSVEPDRSAQHDLMAQAAPVASNGEQEGERNRLLRALPLEVFAQLRPHLTAVPLQLDDTLIEADVAIAHVYFVREGVCSVLAEEQGGGTIEIGTVGCEGFVGLPLLLGADVTSHRTIVQIRGDAWCLSAAAFRDAVESHDALRRILLRYAQYYTDQLSQGVACNRLHTLEERCARWLLMTHDRVTSDRFALKQEYLALMLGVRRAGVSVAMGMLQSAGIIQYARGTIVVRDRPRLEEVSCACYHITRSAYQRLLG